MEISIRKYEDYLYDHYKKRHLTSSMFEKKF